LAKAVAALRAGLVVGVPTDTVYGIAADPFQVEAVRSLFTIKGRPDEKPVSLLVPDLDAARELGSFGPLAEELASRHWPGALTLVVARNRSLPDWVGDISTGTIGLRVPDHPVIDELLRRAGPLAVTSANRSGEPAPLDDRRARELLGEAVAVYLPGACPGGESSTVVDVTGPELRLLRRGPVEPAP
jgi:tRNA threonylcarbamoyl adenosine modification protein (Sua5/YciO/YrdC/YwlC family)